MKLFLVNYRNGDSEPFKSIMQLPKEEAFILAEKLYRQSQCPAHRRFGPDFPSYYEYRLQIEKWLYDSFVMLGGKPETRHPYYFALQYCESLYANFDKGKEVRISLEDIENADVSFTFGDSMAQMERNAVKPLFSKEALYRHMRLYGNDVDKFLRSIKDHYVCIEAQLWTDKYFH